MIGIVYPYTYYLATESIKTRVALWHRTKRFKCEVHEFLGWTFKEYEDWLRTKHIPIKELSFYDYLIKVDSGE